MDNSQLEEKARNIRLSVLDMVFTAGSGHIDSSFSAVEILVALYYRFLKFRQDEPAWAQRDRFILSKGHAAPVLYAILADLGFFPQSDLSKLRDVASHLQGHPSLETPGIDSATGSLGQGLSIACGIAFANERIHRDPSRQVYALLSDGELNEGQIWEAAMMAAHFRLRNLTAIVDCNGLQYTGATSVVMSTEPLRAKFEAFRWEVLVVNGHSIVELCQALARCADATGPTMILAKTVKGKGVSFMENNLEWHGKVPTPEKYRAARMELENG